MDVGFPVVFFTVWDPRFIVVILDALNEARIDMPLALKETNARIVVAICGVWPVH